MKLGLALAQGKMLATGVQQNLPAIKSNPGAFGFVICQICKGNGSNPSGKKCEFCLGFEVLPKGWWFGWSRPYDLLRQPPLENNYNRPPIVDCISEALFYWYMQFPDRCPTCDLGRYGPKPECLDECRFKIRPREKKGGDIQIIDTKRRFPKGYPTPHGTILLSRPMLDFNFRYNLEFIFRCGKANGFQIHHLNGVPYDDRRENYVLTRIHSQIEGILRTIRAQRKRNVKLSESGVLDSDNKRGYDHYANRFEEFTMSVGESPEVISYIQDMNEVINQFKLYGQVPDVLRQKIESYYKI